jgi:hydroxyacylglutathione hydrolase
MASAAYPYPTHPCRQLVIVLAALLVTAPAWSQVAPGSLDFHWSEGSRDCASNPPPPPLGVRRYNAQTFILRESLCSTFEAPFMYLLIGSTRALLIDTGDVADPSRMPLAKTVMTLLPGVGPTKLPLLVVHTHRHLDHRAGDPQLAHLPNVQVVGYDLASVQAYYKFNSWPNGLAHIDLGDRQIDVMPTPGHAETEVSFYDEKTGLFFSGDFLLPGRLLIEDTPADIASADRVANFVRDHPVTFVLGGHVEMNSKGRLFSWGSQYHPDEHILQMSQDDLLALPAILRTFNGIYTVHGRFVMMNSLRILLIEAVVLLSILGALVALTVRFVRRRRRRAPQLRAAAAG